MVLQRDHTNPVWGWATPGEKVTVSIAGQSYSATAGKDGAWRVKLQPLKVNAKGQMLTIKGSNTIQFTDVLVGEVWVCSGQSNMAMSVDRAYDPDLEILTAKYPNIRLISVPQVGTQEPQNDFTGEWAAATPDTVKSFSAVGFFFGRTLHQALDIPIGLIDNAWGGSAAEAWIRRDRLAKLPAAKPFMEQWKQTEATYDHEEATAKFNEKLEKWKTAATAARKAGKPMPRRPRNPRNPLTGQHRPGNLYNGVLKPIIGYGIRGAIWYQGESNSGRAKAYRDVFPLMIQNWRDEWGQGDFPFYWVQLADFRDEQPEPVDDNWAELREAQTMTMDRLNNTGEAVIIDVGEGRDIHPRDKQTVAKRLAHHIVIGDRMAIVAKGDDPCLGQLTHLRELLAEAAPGHRADPGSPQSRANQRQSARGPGKSHCGAARPGARPGAGALGRRGSGLRPQEVRSLAPVPEVFGLHLLPAKRSVFESVKNFATGGRVAGTQPHPHTGRGRQDQARAAQPRQRRQVFLRRQGPGPATSDYTM